MGVTHGNKKTYPRLGDVLGFCTVEQGPNIAEKIMLVQRDNGNRQEYVSLVHTFFHILTGILYLAVRYEVHRLSLSTPHEFR